MPELIDILLVTAVVAGSAAYLIRRKVRAVKAVQRNWESGRAESCGGCPAMKIREAQKTKLENGNLK